MIGSLSAWCKAYYSRGACYDPATNEAEWVPMWGSASDLLLVEETSTLELSNIMPHDPTGHVEDGPLWGAEG